MADYNKILFLNQINGYKGEERGISKSLGVVKKDKQLLASKMQMTHLKASESYITKKYILEIKIIIKQNKYKINMKSARYHLLTI